MTSTLPPPPDMPADATFVPPPAPIEAAPFTQLGLAAPVLAHRLILTADAQIAGRTTETVIADVLRRVAVPAAARA